MELTNDVKWKVLWQNAEEKVELAKLAKEVGHYNSAVEAGFLAIELAYKAALFKNFPDVEDKALWRLNLSKLLNFYDGFLINKLRNDNAAYDLQYQLLSDAIAWRPADRYYGQADENLANIYLNTSERLLKWVQQLL